MSPDGVSVRLPLRLRWGRPRAVPRAPPLAAPSGPGSGAGRSQRTPPRRRLGSTPGRQPADPVTTGGEKANAMMLDAMQGKKNAGREVRDPEADLNRVARP